MHRIYGLLCLKLFLLYLEATSSQPTSNATANMKTSRPKKIDSPYSKFEGNRTRNGSDFNTTKIVWRISVKCGDTAKSCAGRCGPNRQFHDPRRTIDQCFCDPWCDSAFQDCCEDYDEQCNASAMKETWAKNDLDDLWTCGIVDDRKHPIWTIGKCNPGWGDDEIAMKCSRSNEKQISTKIPVIDSNNVTFLNRYCAICNGITVYKPWKFSVKCNVLPTSVYTEPEYWQFIDYFCENIYLELKFPSRGIRYCYDIVTTCKTKASENAKRKCAKQPTGLVAKLLSSKNYRNFDCLLCNVRYFIDPICGPLPFESHKEHVIIRPYSAIFTSSEESSALSSSHCPEGKQYNVRSGKCGELFVADSVKNSDQFLKKFAIVLKYEAANNGSRGRSKDIRCLRFDDVFEKLLRVSLLESKVKFSDLGIHQQNNFSYVATFQILGTETDFDNGEGIPSDYSKIEKLVFHASAKRDKIHGICRYSLTHHDSRELRCTQNTTLIAVKESTIFSNGTLQVSPNQSQSYDEGEYFKYNDSFLAVCTVFKPSNCTHYNVLSNSSDFTPYPNRSIYNRVTKSVFHYGEYAITDGKVWVCLKNHLDFRKKGIVHRSDGKHQIILSYVTLVSLVTSVISLTAVIIVYSLNRALRNLPGKNLMLLCGTLAAGQTLWMMEAVVKPSTVLCTITAILSHFAFLSSFCTSGSIAVNSFLTFRRLSEGKLYSSRNRREFLQYCGYSLGIPGLWVALCWILHACQVISLKNESSSRCWLGNPKSFRIAFLYPVAAQLFVNIILFVITLRNIQKCSKVTRQLQKKNEETTPRHVGIYLRMSTLMGLSWLFGIFVVAFPREVAFEYMFVFANGFQGLYIALAFLLTKNVKKIMSKRFGEGNATFSTSHFSPKSKKTIGSHNNSTVL